MIHLREVTNYKDLRTFIKLPYKIHKNHKEWLPPLVTDEFKVFDKKKNHSFEHCDTIMYLATKNNEVVGRIMGIINHAYNTGNNEKNARFCYLECYDDAEVFDKLLEAIEIWGKEKNMDNIVGPLGFSDKDPQGFLLEGFEDPMTVMVTNCSFEYMISHTERNGYQKKIDLFQYRIQLEEKTPEIYLKIAERVQSRGFKIVAFTKSSEIKPYVKTVFDLINETYTDIYGFAPLDDREAKEFSDRFLPLLNPNYIKLVKDKNDVVVAFVVAMPNISKGFKKANGRLLPFGFIHILKALKTAIQLDMLLGCVKQNIRNFGLDALMAVALFDAARKGNLKVMDSHLTMEENTQMRSTYERMNHEIYKKYRIFEKAL
ncbi:hypothetical protein KCTC32516_01684 [Polaribacter huanghezhanensis]|uniref:hypothetical protein n=1 Tax=Polaribacter huanghezhanensis TaxID=1354726 RepID=UPI0026474DE1|nr:hypothetical protein [Polaribacter huanghezhanensis]WKD86314.1 hypothetical protein KCTC32516_01684 [Polaribacter huanghezhanensis]